MDAISPGWFLLLSTMAKSALILSARPLALATPPTSGETTVSNSCFSK